MLAALFKPQDVTLEFWPIGLSLVLRAWLNGETPSSPATISLIDPKGETIVTFETEVVPHIAMGKDSGSFAALYRTNERGEVTGSRHSVVNYVVANKDGVLARDRFREVSLNLSPPKFAFEFSETGNYFFVCNDRRNLDAISLRKGPTQVDRVESRADTCATYSYEPDGSSPPRPGSEWPDESKFYRLNLASGDRALTSDFNNATLKVHDYSSGERRTTEHVGDQFKSIKKCGAQANRYFGVEDGAFFDVDTEQIIGPQTNLTCEPRSYSPDKKFWWTVDKRRENDLYMGRTGELEGVVINNSRPADSRPFIGGRTIVLNGSQGVEYADASGQLVERPEVKELDPFQVGSRLPERFWSTSGRYFATSRRGTAEFFDATSDEPFTAIGEFRPGSGTPVFSPDDKWVLLTEGEDLYLFHLETGKAAKIWGREKHSDVHPVGEQAFWVTTAS